MAKYNAKYIVTLTTEEQQELREMVTKGKAAAYRIKHANILLASDENGSNLSAQAVAQAYHCHAQTVYNVRQRFVEQGLEAALERKKCAGPPRRPVLDGRGEAQLIALACRKTPDGHSHWALRLLRDELVALGVVERISHETVRSVLKKTRSAQTCENVG